MSDWGTVVGYGFDGVVALVAAVYTTRATMKSKRQTETARLAIEGQRTQVDQTKAVRESYEQAQRITKELIDGLREELTRVQSELGGLRGQLNAERTRSSQLDARVQTLQQSVNRMVHLLRSHNLPVPDGVDL